MPSLSSIGNRRNNGAFLNQGNSTTYGVALNSIPLSAPSLTPKPQAQPEAAVKRFLADTRRAAAKTFPRWQEILSEGIADCLLSYDERRAVFDIHPIDDYYFAGAVALQAARIRPLFPAEESGEVLSLIADTVDAAAERTDRVVSDLVFFIIGRIETVAAADSDKKAYDQAVKVILQRLGLDTVEGTAHLMTQPLFRHALGEPLALGIPDWWVRFHGKYVLARPGAPGAVGPQAKIVDMAVASKSLRRRPPRRAAVF